MLHVPVLCEEVMEFVRETPRSVLEILDGTFGRGGHTRAFFENFENVRVTGLDQDQAALDYGHEHFSSEVSAGRLELLHGNFVSAGELVGERRFDAILLDLGVSSPQLDEAERGFSFYHDGPLDMRMDRSQELTAADVINSYSEQELNSMFKELGEIRSPYRVVRAIVNDRKTAPYESTHQLAGLIERVEKWRKKGHHPATRFFMALRLEVNRELEVVSKALPSMMKLLNPGGRLAVITFHSLEDRIVKNLFKSHNEEGRPVNKKVVIASDEEQKENSRSRSAKLRVFERHQDYNEEEA